MNSCYLIILVLELKSGFLGAAVTIRVALKLEVQINSNFGLVEVKSFSFLYKALNVCVANGYVILAR